MKTASRVLLAGALAATMCASTADAQPRRVICIAAGNDGFLSGCEGYYRSLPPKGNQPNEIQVGGQLSDCLAKVRKGDQLIIVAHGSPGQFQWTKAKGAAGTFYDGYGQGTTAGGNPYPLPDNLRGTNNVTVTLQSCHSSTDPDGDDISVTQSLLNGMNAGGGQNNTVNGHNVAINSRIGFGVKNASRVSQRDSAEINLEQSDAWMDNPPVNRNPVPVPNHKTAAEAQLNAKPEYQGKGLTVNIAYAEPREKTQVDLMARLYGVFCEGVDGFRLEDDPTPALKTTWGRLKTLYR